MLHVINTRPADRAALLSTAIRQAGYRVTELPLLQLDALPLSPALSDQLGRIAQVQCVIVVSPTAADIGLHYLRQCGLDVQQLALQWIAVGQGTAQVLQQAGLPVLVPELETSEGVLALQGVIDPQAVQQVMIWRGIGGRELMLRSLDEQGYVVHNVLLYRRGLPVHAFEQFKLLCGQPPAVLLLSSGESWRYWQQLAQQARTHIQAQAQPASVNLSHILVLGERVHRLVQQAMQVQHPAVQVIRINSLRAEHVLPALAVL